MIDLPGNGYLWVKALHVISVITWMAALFYLPRLFVYHAQQETGSAQSELFKVMERRLSLGIMYPSLVVAVATGTILVLYLWDWSQGWLHVKVTFALLMVVYHFVIDYWRQVFRRDDNRRSHVFYRWANEVPTVFMLIIVFTVYLKPF